jgi:predicted alpha/beta-hydrolase family hydrolase
MTSAAASVAPLQRAKGLVFLGFPLHPPGQPSTRRAEHLQAVEIPMLFHQGTRDAFARLDLISTIAGQLKPRATLHVVEGADHSFGVLKKSGRLQDQVYDELVSVIVDWARPLVGNGA